MTNELLRYHVTRVVERDGEVTLTLAPADGPDAGGIYWVGDVWYRAIPPRTKEAP